MLRDEGRSHRNAARSNFIGSCPRREKQLQCVLQTGGTAAENANGGSIAAVAAPCAAGKFAVSPSASRSPLLIEHLRVSACIPRDGDAKDRQVAHIKAMAISLYLACSIPYSESVATQRVAPAATPDVVRRVAEARGWDEPAAARFINTLLRLLHTIKSE